MFHSGTIMSDTIDTNKNQWSLRAALLFGAGSAMLFLWIQYLGISEVVHDNKIYFLDPDSYTWLTRAEHVLGGEGLYVHHDPLDNYPHGFAPHWTQPLHWLLAVLAGIFGLFMKDGSALEWAGVWICPLFGALTAGWLAVWSSRRLPWSVSVMMVLVLLVHPFEQWSFALGRPDHQCLIVFLSLGAVLFFMQRESSDRVSKAGDAGCALFLAAGVWVSVQVLSIWGLITAMLILRASLARPADRAALVVSARYFCGVGALGAFFFALAEGTLFTLRSDAHSLAHAVLMTMPFLGLWTSFVFLQRMIRPGKAAWFLACTLPTGLITGVAAGGIWYYQGIYYSPEALDAMGRWFSTNLEFMPSLFRVNGEIGLGRFHSAFGWTFYLLPLLIFGLYKTRLVRGTTKSFLIIGIVAASGLTIWQMRWRDMHALLLIPVLPIAAHELIIRVKALAQRPLLRHAAVIVVGLIALAPWIRDDIKLLTQTRIPQFPYRAIRQICETLQAVAPYSENEENPAVLAVWDQGPMVRYWSKRPVLAGPYHPNIEGILDTLRAYSARTQAEFQRLMDARKVGYVLRPPMADPYYDLYSFEWILGKADPLLFIRSRQMTADGRGTMRGYDLCPGKTVKQLEGNLRFRLENNQWAGWGGLTPVTLPGLDKIAPDAEVIPYLYRCERGR